jgi:hypothetical protein
VAGVTAANCQGSDCNITLSTQQPSTDRLELPSWAHVFPPVI